MVLPTFKTLYAAATVMYQQQQQIQQQYGRQQANVNPYAACYRTRLDYGNGPPSSSSSVAENYTNNTAGYTPFFNYNVPFSSSNSTFTSSATAQNSDAANFGNFFPYNNQPQQQYSAAVHHQINNGIESSQVLIPPSQQRPKIGQFSPSLLNNNSDGDGDFKNINKIQNMKSESECCSPDGHLIDNRQSEDFSFGTNYSNAFSVSGPNADTVIQAAHAHHSPQQQQQLTAYDNATCSFPPRAHKDALADNVTHTSASAATYGFYGAGQSTGQLLVGAPSVSSSSVNYATPEMIGDYPWMRNTRQAFNYQMAAASAMELSSIASAGRTRTRDKYRMVYTDYQRLELEKEFRFHTYITTQRKIDLSRALGLSERQIKIWFQNRRAKERKQTRKVNGERRSTRSSENADGPNEDGSSHSSGSPHGRSSFNCEMDAKVKIN